MPNWAMGTVETVGTMDAILAFSKRFIANDDSDNGNLFFARSFLNDDRASIEADIRQKFQELPSDAEGTYDFYISFAWSAYSCMIQGYPQENEGRCITLSAACALDCVNVKITTKETSMWFEELITCDRNGVLDDKCNELTCVRCKHCGSSDGLASFEDISTLECWECGETGFEYLDGNEETAECDE